MQSGWSFSVELPEDEEERATQCKLQAAEVDLHCLKYTDDQFQWVTMLEKVGPVVEQSNITELLMDYGAASQVRPCRMTAGYSYEEAFLNATDTQVTSQGMVKAKSQLVEVP